MQNHSTRKKENRAQINLMTLAEDFSPIHMTEDLLAGIDFDLLRYELIDLLGNELGSTAEVKRLALEILYTSSNAYFIHDLCRYKHLSDKGRREINKLMDEVKKEMYYAIDVAESIDDKIVSTAINKMVILVIVAACEDMYKTFNRDYRIAAACKRSAILGCVEFYNKQDIFSLQTVVIYYDEEEKTVVAQHVDDLDTDLALVWFEFELDTSKSAEFGADFRELFYGVLDLIPDTLLARADDFEHDAQDFEIGFVAPMLYKQKKR